MSENKIFTTADLMKKYAKPGIFLRRIIRTMPAYDDGVFTRYAWTRPQYDAVCKFIDARMKGKPAAKPAAAKKSRKPATRKPAAPAALPADTTTPDAPAAS